MSPRTVLIIDDDADATFLLGAHLERLQVTVHTSHSLAEAQRSLAALSPAIVLCDKHLGDGCGLSLFDDARPSGVRLALLLSGENTPATLIAQAKFDGQHIKPVDVHAIIDAVHATLNRD